MNRYLLTLTAVSAAMILASSGPSIAQCGGGMSSGGHSTHAENASSESKMTAYPIDYCIVSGEKLGGMGDPVKYEYKDRTVYFCCKGCVKKFEAEPAKYLAVLDDAIASADAARAKSVAAVKPIASAKTSSDTTKFQSAPKLTTLDWCIVSGEPLGAMGKTVSYKYKDRDLTFCCKGCVKEFEKTPAAYLAKLDSALAGQIKQPMEAEDAKDEHQGGASHH